MKTTTELITPEIAKVYLSRSGGNRTIRQKWVNDLANMMRRGEFFHTHQGIAFNCDGSLKDGHHRLMAIVESGTQQTMQVTNGVTDEAHLVTDWMRARSVADAMVIEGDEWVTMRIIAMARMWCSLLYGDGVKAKDGLVVRRFAMDKREHLVWASSIASNTVYGHACILTMLAIAHEKGHGDEAATWYEAFKTGVAREEWQTSAVCLRDWWMRNNTGGGRGQRTALCKRVYGSLRAWIERRPLSKSYEATKIDWIDGDKDTVTSHAPA